MASNRPRFMLTAPRSGSGKTTLTVGILRALSRRGLTPAACKCGPDYIDPMFHRRVLGVDGYNLDLFFTPAGTVRNLLWTAGATAGITLVEGAMGYYDGIGATDEASAYDVSRVTDTPAVLVLPVGGSLLSLAAVVDGFRRFRPDSRVRGVILNQTTASFYDKARAVIERETGLPVFGYLGNVDALPSRHLGLVTPDGIQCLQSRLDELADRVEETVDLDGLLELAASADDLEAVPPVDPVWRSDTPVRIAVARDEAFCFYYRENLELLEAMGAELVSFSPLRDNALPAGTRGLYLGGGYPEVYAEQLAGNGPLLREIRAALSSGLPTLAECGGFLYLQEELEDENGKAFRMVGHFPDRGFRTERLCRFGYVSVAACHDNLLLRSGETIRAHEFHYWDVANPGTDCLAVRPSGLTRPCVIATARLFAGFPHLSFPANPTAAANFIKACLC